MVRNTKEPTPKRGRPKAQHFISFRPPVYKSPLGFNYTQPVNFNTFKNIPMSYTPHPVRASSASQHLKMASASENNLVKDYYKPKRTFYQKSRKKESDSEEEEEESYEESTAESVSLETVEEDPHERLLQKDGTKFLVKFRGRSYLHCDWVEQSEISVTRAGHLKVRKFKPVEIKDNWTKVERVIYEDEEGFILIKWKGIDMPYELATFESKTDLENCDGFNEEYEKYKQRRIKKHFKHTIHWRPPADFLIHKDEKTLREESEEGKIIYEGGNFTNNISFKKGNKLRDYQLEGLNWLINRWKCRQSCLMADEMGLGKTIQSVVFVDALHRYFEYSAPILVVAPLSTLDHWKREFEAWTDFRILKYHGSKADREIIAAYEFNYTLANVKIELFDVIITTYEMAMSGAHHLQEIEFGIGIFDEAHRLKNPASKAGKALRSLYVHHKVLLSGTPIQNNLTELWALLNFIEPERFESLNYFLTQYRMENSSDVEKLQNLLKCLMLRRMKDDVETSIPSKEETIVEVVLTTIQKRYYRAILERNIEFLRSTQTKSAPNLMNLMMEIRKCCIHPYLIAGAEDFIIPNYLLKKGCDYVEPKTNDEYHEILIQSSGKLVLLDKLLHKLQGKHKVLIFSQMTKCLDLLQTYLEHRKFNFERIDGNVRGNLRQDAIDRFSKSDDAFVFLLCTKAGGVGINLTAADTCIIFDSDWNPQNDLQAQARCHRIGQTNAVKIYRLITKNTYEREMFDKAGLKLGLDKAILQKMSYDSGNNSSNVSINNEDVNSDHNMAEEKSHNKSKLDSIQTLLKKGAYGVLMENDEVGDKFCEEDIDKILERSKVIKQEDQQGKNLFSKATFQVTEEIDDLFFWDFIVNHKNNENDEMKMKRHTRKISRETDLSEEERSFVVSNYMKLLANKLNINYASFMHNSDITENFISWYNQLQNHEDKILLVFLEFLLNSQTNFTHSFFNSANELESEARTLIEIFNYCLDLIPTEKLKGDFLISMDIFGKISYDLSSFEAYTSVYLNLYEKFLFRVQIPNIFYRYSNYIPSIEPARGFNKTDDEMILNKILKVGYGNFDVRDKPRKDVMQRVRKLISSIYHKIAMKEGNNTSFKAILNFGRVTIKNTLSVETFLNRSTVQIKEIIEKIFAMPKSKRKVGGLEASCYDRIVFFDKLTDLQEIPACSIKRGVMPKGWDAKKDKELRDYLIIHGFADIERDFKISEELAIKRFEQIFKMSKTE